MTDDVVTADCDKILRMMAGRQQGEFLEPARFQEVIGDISRCVTAQTVLQQCGLIQLAPPPQTGSRVCAAALTRNGARHTKQLFGP